MLKPIMRKAIVIGGMNIMSIGNGFMYGQMPGLIRALRKNDDGISLSDREISLIAATITILSMSGFGLAAAITDKIGRRKSFIILSIPTILNWILLYYAKEMPMFMLSRVFGGIGFGAIFCLNICTTSEYTSPKTRALFLHVVITVGSAVGTGLGHAFGIVLHWRTTALLGIIPAIFGVVLPFFWVESPYWLATKGRFKDCEEAFWKLHEKTSKSKLALQWLIQLEKNKLEKADALNSRSTLKRLCLAFKRKYFWNLMLLTVFMHIFITTSGKAAFSTYATVILEEVTGTSNVLMYTLLVDASFVLGSCMSLILIRKMSMRNLIFVTGCSASAILAVLGVCIFFKNEEVYFSWINVTLMGAYFIVLNSGPYPALEALLGEIFPLELKVYCFFLTGIILTSLLGSMLFLFPYMVNALGYYGVFLLNAGIMSVSLCFLWLRLPETKGRTLQEIEVYFKTKNFDVEEVLSNEKIQSLI